MLYVDVLHVAIELHFKYQISLETGKDNLLRQSIWISDASCTSSTRLKSFVALIVMQLKFANQVCCPQLKKQKQTKKQTNKHNPLFFISTSNFYTPSQRNPETGRNNPVFLCLLAIPLTKSAQISEVAQKFPCCVIRKTSDQRKEPVKVCLYRLAVQPPVLIPGEQWRAVRACARHRIKFAECQVHGKVTKKHRCERTQKINLKQQPKAKRAEFGPVLHRDRHYRPLKGNDLW